MWGASSEYSPEVDDEGGDGKGGSGEIAPSLAINI